MSNRKYNFNENVFENIDTKEKAYWHGFISADGYINCGKNSRQQFVNQIGIQLSIKDEILIDRFLIFINAPKKMKKYRTKHNDKYHYKNKQYRYCHVHFNSNKMVHDFLKYTNLKEDEINHKAERLSLPNFGLEQLNLAWLLGYYDGDGSENSPRITSCNKNFLEEIKKKYNIDFDITKPSSKNNTYVLYIGEHFREILCHNYVNSLERKRISLIGRKKRGKSNNLSKITKQILRCALITHSTGEIGKMFCVPRMSIFTRAKSLGIEIPKRRGGRKSKKEKLKKDCVFYPCHEGMSSCEICYCPLYYYDCGGDYIILDNGIKDCSNCKIPHDENGHDYIVDLLKRRDKHGLGM